MVRRLFELAELVKFDAFLHVLVDSSLLSLVCRLFALRQKKHCTSERLKSDVTFCAGHMPFMLTGPFLLDRLLE